MGILWSAGPGFLEELEAHLVRGVAHGARVDEALAQIDSNLRIPASLSR